MWRAVAIGTVVAGAYLGLSWAVYRWGIPVRQTVGAEVLLGLPLAVTGAVIGHRLGRPAAATYTVNKAPQLRGAVGALVHWPRPILWLFGALPGLLLIATAARRREHAVS